MATQALTRTQVQAMRIRMAAAIHDWNTAELHRALSIKVNYETIRRIWADERIEEVPYSLLRAIADATGVEVTFVAGDADATLPDRAKGLSRNRVLGGLSQPVPALAA